MANKFTYKYISAPLLLFVLLSFLVTSIKPYVDLYNNQKIELAESGEKEEKEKSEKDRTHEKELNNIFDIYLQKRYRDHLDHKMIERSSFHVLTYHYMEVPTPPPEELNIIYS